MHTRNSVKTPAHFCVNFGGERDLGSAALSFCCPTNSSNHKTHFCRSRRLHAQQFLHPLLEASVELIPVKLRDREVTVTTHSQRTCPCMLLIFPFAAYSCSLSVLVFFFTFSLQTRLCDQTMYQNLLTRNLRPDDDDYNCAVMMTTSCQLARCLLYPCLCLETTSPRAITQKSRLTSQLDYPVMIMYR